jgi:hypothetical protein
VVGAEHRKRIALDPQIIGELHHVVGSVVISVFAFGRSLKIGRVL